MNRLSSRIILIIPTYNEYENIAKIAARIKTQNLHVDLLFVDDNSPDGTKSEIERLQTEEAWIHAIHRPSKLGIGSAHRDGLAWAYNRGYDVAVTMDCDLTHSADNLADFLFLAETSSVVLGSRFLEPNSLPGWSLWRRFLTHTGHRMTKLLLNIPYDATGGFRAYRLNAIPRDVWDLIHSQGYSFLFESLFVLSANGAKVKEIPICLPARTYGVSKMRWKDVYQSVRLLLTLCWRRFNSHEDFLLRVQPQTTGSACEWDKYWSDKGSSPTRVYSLVAKFYRMLVIRPNISRQVMKVFSINDRLLHAGCGGGESDIDIAKRNDILAFDISGAALSRYRQTNGALRPMVQGSIFQMPFPDASFDGIYNLGVMEHFTVEQALLILKEFRRVLRPCGRLLLLWPPRYGLSVMVLSFAHHLARRLGLQMKLHPDEPGLLASKTQGLALLREAGFANIQYEFSWRDLFVQAVLTATTTQSDVETAGLSS